MTPSRLIATREVTARERDRGGDSPADVVHGADADLLARRTGDGR